MASSSNSSISYKKSIKEKTFNGVGNLIRVLPTGTVFLFQFLNPLLTNNGECTTTNKVLSAILIGFCSFSCFLSTFTDSYTDNKGTIHYGFATVKGFYPSSSSDSSVDFSSYKIKLGDFVHAVFALFVFGMVSLLDTNTVDCFYPSFKSSTKNTLVTVAPVVLATIAGTVFVVFPNKRHGIGYPSSQLGNYTSSSDANHKASLLM